MRNLAASSLLLLAATLQAPAAVVTGDGAREEFLFNWERVASFEEPVHDSPRLRRYLLYPYLEAARLRERLGSVPAGTRDVELEKKAHGFLDRLGQQPVANGVWQTLLGYYGRRSAWREFLETRAWNPDRRLPTENLACYEFSARIATQQADGVRDAAFAQWETSGTPSDACAPVYAWLDTPDRLSQEEIERRSRYAARRGYELPASYESLPEARKKVLVWLKRLDVSPTASIKDFIARRPAPVGTERLATEMLAAFERVARLNSARARPLFGQLLRDGRFSGEQKVLLRRDFALGLAYDRDPEAVKRFAQVPSEALGESGREWRLRSAIWNGKWQLVQRWLDELPPAEAQTPRWLYWRGRMERLRGQDDSARRAWEQAAKEREYYAFLSAERLGRAADLRHKPIPEDWPTLDLLASTPALRRARELLACDLRDLAALEFNHAVRDLPESTKAQAIRLASNWGWHKRAVILQAQLQLWDDLWLRFPLPYEAEVDSAARQSRIPPNWLYTVMRTESLYDPKAVSGAGAMGLLQLMPATARAVARSTGLRQLEREDLFRPEINIPLGARYLRELSDRFSGRLVLMLAAYNAGPHRVTGWLPRRPIDADIWIENVPYNETRNYIQRALSSLVMIGWRRTGEPAPILPLLDPVHAKLEAGT